MPSSDRKIKNTFSKSAHLILDQVVKQCLEKAKPVQRKLKLFKR